MWNCTRGFLPYPRVNGIHSARKSFTETYTARRCDWEVGNNRSVRPGIHNERDRIRSERVFVRLSNRLKAKLEIITTNRTRRAGDRCFIVFGSQSIRIDIFFRKNSAAVNWFKSRDEKCINRNSRRLYAQYKSIFPPKNVHYLHIYTWFVSNGFLCGGLAIRHVYPSARIRRKFSYKLIVGCRQYLVVGDLSAALSSLRFDSTFPVGFFDAFRRRVSMVICPRRIRTGTCCFDPSVIKTKRFFCLFTFTIQTYNSAKSCTKMTTKP